MNWSILYPRTEGVKAASGRILPNGKPLVPAGSAGRRAEKPNDRQKIWHRMALYQPHIRSLLILGVALFGAEFSVSYVLEHVTGFHRWVHHALDAVVMLTVAFPALYWLVLRPWHQQVCDLQLAQEALQEANADLERRAAEQRQLEKQVLDIMEAERQRVGRDLHDSLGAKLAGVALMSQALSQRLTENSPADAELAQEVVGCVSECISQTRSISRGLCPVELSYTGLVSGLLELAAETQRRSNLLCRLHADDHLALADFFATAHLFRIAQEAVANAVRHGQPRQITITLGARGEHLCLEIRDDGKGFGAQTPASPGLGLRTMNYRAGHIGGVLTVRAGEAGGTVVTCLLPLVRLRDQPERQP